MLKHPAKQEPFLNSLHTLLNIPSYCCEAMKINFHIKIVTYFFQIYGRNFIYLIVYARTRLKYTKLVTYTKLVMYFPSCFLRCGR